MNPLITLAAILFIIGLLIMFGGNLVRLFKGEEPEVERKWTDPVYRDRGGPQT